MNRNKLIVSLLIFSSLLLAASCSNTRNLADNESLYTGSDIRINDRVASSKERKFLRKELKAAVRPLPNKKTLGMRVKLRMYNLAGNPAKKKGFRNWLRNKAGEAPVLTSSLDIPSNEALLSNILRNRGFFFNTVTGSVTVKHKKASAYFDVSTGDQYHIRNTYFPDDTLVSAIARDMAATATQTLLRPGSPFNLDLIKGERLRIDKELKEKGYYYFRPDYLFIEADTTVGDHKVDMKLKVKRDSVPDIAYNIYHIKDVYIYTNYRLNSSNADTNNRDAVVYEGYHIVDRRKTYRPFLFRDMLLFGKGDIYNRTDQNTSISRLINLNTFKFVKNRFEPVDDTALEVFYYLSPFPKKSLRLELGANTQNDSRAGSDISVSWRNRNTFRAAEEFMVKINGGFETQYTGIAKQPAIYTLGAQVGFSFPYFVVPFVHINSYSSVVPRTIIRAAYSYEAQQGLLRINSYKLSYGYNWKETIRKEHQFYPFNINYVRTDTLSGDGGFSANYGSLLFNGLIFGPTYEFTYNSQVGSSRRDNYYFDGLIDWSALVTGAIQRADYETNPQKILGQNYAQYAKAQADFRYYHRFPNNNVWASRILVGAGIPYGNSAQLPNIKQFFSGGNSSLRGFRSRLLGPGTFNEKYLKGTTNYIQMLGDMKLELNTELRMEVYKFFKLGFFADAGNIWLYNNNPDLPGGQFSSSFIKELAMDMGLGLRFDFKILLLRFDMAVPVRVPWLPENQRWVFNSIDLGSPEWRSNNLIFNLAIGYPF